MKVGVVTTSYPRFPDDPAGNFVGEHVRALRALGHEVEVIAAGDDADHDARVSSGEDSITRIPSHGLFYTGGAPDLIERDPRRALGGALFAVRMTAAVVRRRFDSIVAHWLAPSALACLPTTAPLLAIAHGGDVHTLRRANLLGPTLHLLRARDAQIVFVSDELRWLAIDSAPRLAGWIYNARVQPMGIDVTRFSSIPRASTTPPTIAIISRLVPIKGVDVALAALEHVQHRVKLVIAGDGPERGRLLELARTKYHPRVVTNDGDSNRSDLFDAPNNSVIEFLGPIDTRRRDQLLSHASLVVVPSRVIAGRTEGTPLIALEAMAAGITVIASDVGGLGNLAAAIKVRPEDPRELADAIDRMLDHPRDPVGLRFGVLQLDWRHVGATLVRSP